MEWMTQIQVLAAAYFSKSQLFRNPENNNKPRPRIEKQIFPFYSADIINSLSTQHCYNYNELANHKIPNLVTTYIYYLKSIT